MLQTHGAQDGTYSAELNQDHDASQCCVAVLPALSLTRSAPAEDGQLKNLEIAIHVFEADFAQPLALYFNRCQNVRRFVFTVIILGCDLLPSLGGLPPLMHLSQRVNK